MTDIKSMTRAELSEAFAAMGQPRFRAGQVFAWLHRGVRSFDEMTNLPKALREQLAGQYELTAPAVARKQVSAKDGTIKYLWRLGDGHCVESVLMRYHHGNTVCISSEVGCAMGCAFCASTKGGLVRRLHIVLMGIGEPLDNYDNVRRFLALVNDPEGMNIGMRHISLSTCGLVPGIDRLAEEDLQLTLSVSLHAPDDALRSSLMPVNRRYPIDELLAACKRYFEKTGRRISFEYAMIDGRNDTPEMAQLLIRRLEEYKQFRETAESMKAFEEAAKRVFTKLPEEYPLPPQEVELTGLTLDGLREAFLRVLSRRPRLDDNPESNHYAPRNIHRDSHTVQECMLDLMKAVKQKKRMRFEEAFSDAPTKEEVVTYFLAVLELLKLGQMHVRQDEVYGGIELLSGRPRKKKAADLADLAQKGDGEP